MIPRMQPIKRPIVNKGGALNNPVVRRAVSGIDQSMPSELANSGPQAPGGIPQGTPGPVVPNPGAMRQTAIQAQFQKHDDFGKGINKIIGQAQSIRQQKMKQQQLGGNVAGNAKGGWVNPKGAGPRGWGNFRNGQIPPQALKGLSWAPRHRMRADAAVNFERLNAAYRQAFGRNISITDSYRDYNGQVRMKKLKGSLAARPGTSNHGWGLALDLGGGINREGSRENQWMNQNAHRFGFGRSASPRIAQLEPWHWEYRG